MDGLARIAEAVDGSVLVAILVFARVLGLTVLMPALGERSVSPRVRGAVAAGLALVLFPAVSGITPEPAARAMPGLIATELLFGLALGTAVRLIVLALQICGSIIAQVTSLAQLIGMASAEPLPVIGHILAFGGLALLVMADVHVRIAVTLVATYGPFPVGALLDPGDIAGLIVARVSEIFSLAFVLASPFVIAALLYNLALGAISRAMPQLMVALVGAPAILMATITLLFVVSPLLLSQWLELAKAALADPFGAR